LRVDSTPDEDAPGAVEEVDEEIPVALEVPVGVRLLRPPPIHSAADKSLSWTTSLRRHCPSFPFSLKVTSAERRAYLATFSTVSSWSRRSSALKADIDCWIVFIIAGNWVAIIEDATEATVDNEDTALEVCSLSEPTPQSVAGQ